MEQHRLAKLLHPAFIFSLVFLFLNDHWFKYEYHTWLTGKLSDFAGVYAFTFFLLTAFPQRQQVTGVICALFFVWWKSPVSQGVIDLFGFTRIVDYTDLVALTMVPVAAGTFNRIDVKYHKVWAERFMFIVALFSFWSSSLPRQLFYYDPYEKIDVRKTIVSRKSKDELLKILAPDGDFKIDSIRYSRVYPSYSFYHQYRDSASVTRTPVANSQDTALMVRTDESPFYIIRSFVLEDDTLTNMEVFFEENKKKTYMTIRSFNSSNYSALHYTSSGILKRKYRRMFKEMFQ